MGVTIHFEGTLRDEAAFEHVIRSARTRAVQEGWKSEVIAEDIATLWRVRNEEDCEYTGPTRGILLYPHENAEPLRLEFDRDLFGLGIARHDRLRRAHPVVRARGFGQRGQHAVELGRV